MSDLSGIGYLNTVAEGLSLTVVVYRERGHARSMPLRWFIREALTRLHSG
jgi:hypothetical protein